MNSLLRALQTRVHHQPDSIVLEDGAAAVSATELLARLEALGLYLRERGLKTVALYADNSVAWAIVDLACQLESLCLVPIPTFFSAAQVAHLLDSAGVELLFFDAKLADQLPQTARSRAKSLSQLPELSFAVLTPEYLPRVPPHTTKITFTSGSTGTPKGVCLSFQQCLNVAASLAEAIDYSSPRHLSVLPLSTLLENIGGIYMPILAGGSCVVVPPAELGMAGSSGLDSQRFLSALERYQPNTLILVPALLAVLDAALAQGWQPPASIVFVAVGGARVAPAVVQRVRAAGLPVYEGYGLSECASVVSLNTPDGDRLGTSGRVLPHVEVFERHGEIEVSGNTFLGYLDKPATWGVSSVSTGDVGSIDADGYITIEGRSKNILITSFGRNVSPEWVESELLANNYLQQVFVLGDGYPYCVALLLPGSAEMTDSDIQAAVDQANAGLPDYARVEQWLRLNEPMTSANGLLTANGRPRRDFIGEQYSKQIDQLYSLSKESAAL